MSETALVVIILSLAAIGALLLIRRKRKAIFALSAVVLLLLIFAADNIRLSNGSIIFSPAPEHFGSMNGNSMYSAARSVLINTVPMYVSSAGSGKRIFIDYPHTPSPAVSIRRDTGIDTVISMKDSVDVIVKAFRGEFPQCTLEAVYASGKALYEAANGSNMLSADGLESIRLLAADDNPFNQYWSINAKPRFLLCSDRPLRYIQQKAFELNSLFHEAVFYPGILRKGKLLSLNKDFDGYIMLGNTVCILPDSAYVMRLADIDYASVENFLENAPVLCRVKNPGSPDEVLDIKGMKRKSDFSKSLFLTGAMALLSFLLVMFI